VPRALSFDHYKTYTRDNRKYRKGNHNQGLCTPEQYIVALVRNYLTPRVLQGCSLDRLLADIESTHPGTHRLTKHLKAMTVLELRKTRVSQVDEALDDA
jgi:hypothetical protein